jgi:hypothetical protein
MTKRHSGMFKKGERKVGRAKGTPNKLTRTVKEALDAAAQILGGEQGATGTFVAAGKKDIVAFANILARTIPLEMKAALEGSLEHTVSHITITPVAHGDLVGPDDKLYSHEAHRKLWPELHPDTPTTEPDVQAMIAAALSKPNVIEHEPLDVEQQMREALQLNAELMERARKAGLL